MASGSVQPSPEPPRGRDIEQFPPPLQLPDSVLSRKTSTSSLAQSLPPTGGGSTSEAVSKGGIIRRLSSRARAPRFTRARRQSSAHPISRDASVGPGVIRRGRSNSNVFTDSDSDDLDGREDLLFGSDGAPRDYSPTSAGTSIIGAVSPTGAAAGPVIPLTLLRGTWISKVSRKKKTPKRIQLTLDLDAAKLTWDRNRPQKRIYIDDIKEIRTGLDIRQYRLDAGIPEIDESRFFSILYAVDKGKNKMMHLIADDRELFTDWVQTLDAISQHRQDLMASLMSFNDKAIRLYWESEMARKLAERPGSHEPEGLGFGGVERVCRNLHIHTSLATMRQKFDCADVTQTGRLNFVEFQEFVRSMARREDIRAIYRELASDTESGITCAGFLDFLREVQGENVDDDVPGWEAVFNRFARRTRPMDAEKEDGDSDPVRMSEGALASFLTSTYNLAIPREPQNYSLDRPMNEYFISSSHNTYLLGRQVWGSSSVEGYISALIQGCRCVEVDCWDGSDGQPIVIHGKTFTSQIHFREVINTINKYAFAKTQYPLWISLEVHCNPAQQAIMAEIMKEVFGSKLVTKPLESASNQLPSPSEMKGRILTKVKKPQQQVEDVKPAEATGRRRGNSLTSPYPKPMALDNASIPGSPLLSSNGTAPRRASA
ncbi:MAG: phosphatidylinositol-specific phospholipase C domain-containing protein, partial [Thaumarchaeota archaeon]|nr:phosphatidylinositol-specific phospholipase C domain-containing protein [Nitrososphaerota archaeon]